MIFYDEFANSISVLEADHHRVLYVFLYEKLNQKENWKKYSLFSDTHELFGEDTLEHCFRIIANRFNGKTYHSHCWHNDLHQNRAIL